MLKTLSIDELEVGMFVKDIILKNTKHKVKNQGKVNSLRTIELLKKQGAVNVVIEVDQHEQASIDVTHEEKNNPPQKTTTLAEEFSQSCQLYDQATENVKKLFAEASSGKKLTTEKIHVLADEITESVLRNEYAITLLTRIRQQSNYQWEHAINTAVLLCGFSVYLGLDTDEIKKITLGALFHDIGTARVPKAILDKKSSLSANEMSVVKKHITWGIEIGKRDKILNETIIDMMVNHHERLDGSGYPRGVDQEHLSELARMAAIVDVYDAMTGDKPYKKGEPPMVAMRHLISNKDKFDQGLVQQFIKFLGVHPVGSLVKLSNDKLAIVTEGNRDDPLKPVIQVIYSLKLNNLITPKRYDLAEEDTTILSAVRSDDFQINLTKLIRNITM